MQQTSKQLELRSRSVGARSVSLKSIGANHVGPMGLAELRSHNRGEYEEENVYLMFDDGSQALWDSADKIVAGVIKRRI